MSQRTWLITGAGRGLGRAIVDGVLGRGDRVVATARQPDALAQELAEYGEQALVLPLDVADRTAVSSVVEKAIDQTGQIDVVVNNAGYGLSGGVEEVSEDQVRAQFDTNFFGALWVTQAVLPHLRARRSGHIVQISSIAGLIAGPNTGIYAASKWALEAMSEALASEVGPLGIKVTILEPSGMRTDWAGGSMERATPIADYDEVLAKRREAFASAPSPAVYTGDPALVTERIFDIVEHPEPPLRLLLGNTAVNLATAAYESRMKAFTAWDAVSRSIDTA